MPRPPRAARARRSSSGGASASARASSGRPIAASAARAGTSAPGRASSSERASDLRRCAKASRITRARSGVAPGPRLSIRSSADSTRGRGVNTAGSTLLTSVTSQASWAITLGEPYSRVPGAARSRSAISRCTITSQLSIDGSSAIVRSSSGVAIE